jgi:protein-ribulosamine 3-kinase
MTLVMLTINFAQTFHGDRGKGMISGEFTSMSLIYEAKPDLVPKPIAWGTYATIPNVHFFLSNFHDMTDELPDLHTFPAMIAELHRNGTSPNGKFGFPTTTYHGNTPIDHGWSNTWEEYFKRTTSVLLKLEQESQGPNKELLDLVDPFLNKVVPRLLRPLETGGRSIKPCLIHGGLWHGNATMDGDSELPIIFDAASCYAHNECRYLWLYMIKHIPDTRTADLGVWRATWNKIGKPYITRYHKNFPISPPEEDHDDRNALYAT